jgi:hypothetical protein
LYLSLSIIVITEEKKKINLFCLIAYSRMSYLAAVTIAGDRAANLDLCLALMCHTCGDTGPPFLSHIPGACFTKQLTITTKI